MTLKRKFAALSDPARRDLLVRLASGPRTAGELAEPYRISRPAVSRHLRVLREAGLVSVENRGRERWYSLDLAGLEEARFWLEEVEQVWSTALQSLKRYVEGEK